MKLTTLMAALALACAGAAQAQGSQDAAKPSGSAPAASAARTLTDGEVRKIDKSAGKITLRHGPIVNLDMGAMTMVFRVADPKLLDAVKEGDKVRFSAEKLNGAYTVTGIEAVK